MAPHRIEGLLASARLLATLLGNLLGGFKYPFHVHGHQVVGRRTTQLVQETSGNLTSVIRVKRVVGGPTLGNSPVEQAVGSRHGQHVGDAERPS